MKQHSQTKIVEGIKNLPRNRFMSQNNEINDVLQIDNVRCCGMIFSGHIAKNGQIVGSELNRTEGPQYLYNPHYM